MKRSQHECLQTGYSLIELMVAMVIGAVLMLGAATLFVESKVSYLQDEELARLQETGRFGMRYVGRELSMGGFFGGVLDPSDIDQAIVATTPVTCYSWMLDTTNRIEHFNDVDVDGLESGTGAVNMPADCLATGEVQAGTDILVIRRTADDPTVDQLNASNPTPVSGIHYLRVRNYNVELTLERTLSAAQPSNVDLWQYVPQIVFIRNGATAEDGVPTLCRRQLSDTAASMEDTECLLQGVEDLQVEFGLDESGDQRTDRFESFPSEAEVNGSLAARIFLLARSPEEVAGYTNDKTYTYGTKNLAAFGDGFYRRLMQTTVSLRNSEGLGI